MIPAEAMPPSNNILSYPTEETLTEEEKRIEGFKRFEEICFARTRRPNTVEKENGNKKLVQSVNIIRTDVNVSAYIRDEMLKAGQSDTGDGSSSGMLTPRSSTATVQRRASVADRSPIPSAVVGFNIDSKDADGMKLSKSSPLNVIAAAMQTPNAVQFKDRRWHFKMYHRVFIGSDAVQWMLRAFLDIETHEDAVAFGNTLLERGLFEHVKKSHKFLDGHYFYWLTKEYTLPATVRDRHSPVGNSQVAAIVTKSNTSGWFGSGVPSVGSVTSTPSSTSNATGKHEQDSQHSFHSSLNASSLVAATDKVSETAKDNHSYQVNNNGGPNTQTPITTTSNLVAAGSLLEHLQKQQQQQPHKQTFELSKKLIIDLDPQTKSDRQETAILYYDTIYCHNASYHFQLHWLLCTSNLIKDMVVAWRRVAERCGLKLVEAPVEQAIPFSNDDPFLSVIPIHLAVQPPNSATVLERLGAAKKDSYLYFEQELLRSEGFVLDMESADRFPPGSINPSYNMTYRYTQYVHRTGVAFVQIREAGQGFYWIDNRLYLTTNQGSSNPATRIIASGNSYLSSSNLPHSQLAGPNSNNVNFTQQIPTPTSATSSSVSASFASQFVTSNLRQRFTSVCSDTAYLEEFWKRLLPMGPISDAVDEVCIMLR